MPSTKYLILRSAEGASRRTHYTPDATVHLGAPSPSNRRARAPQARSVGIFGRGAIAADPGIGPVGDLALVLRQIGAPGIGLDRLLGLPHHIELPVRADLTDHHRLRQVMIG